MRKPSKTQVSEPVKSEIVHPRASNEATVPFKRLFFDLEVSPNLVFSWNIGRKISLGHDSIVNERAIICVSWKFEGEKKAYSLEWNKGNDKELLEKFIKVLNSADEIVAHNGDQFDIKWLRARCLLYGIPMFPDYHSVDTLKVARKYFRLNSNKLDYISQFLGIGKKQETGYGLWRDIVLKNDKQAMDKMVKYCKNDVILLEQVYKKLDAYSTHKSHVGVHMGKSNHSCPSCGSVHSISNGQRIMASGLRKQRLQCQDCGKYWTINLKKED